MRFIALMANMCFYPIPTLCMDVGQSNHIEIAKSATIATFNLKNNVFQSNTANPIQKCSLLTESFKI